MGLDPTVLRDELFELCNQKDLQTLHWAAHQGFSKLHDPLGAVLTILESCPGKQKGRNHTAGRHILMEFQTWLEENPQVSLSSLSEQQATSLQHRALQCLTDNQAGVVTGLIDIYNLASLDPDTLRLPILRLQVFNCYKEAAALSMRLELQRYLNMEEMCVPLILQDKITLAEAFVKGHSDLEQKLVTLLDSWSHPGFSVEDVYKQFPGLVVSKHCLNQIHPKLLTKHVLRLAEKFNIDQGLYPNALHRRRRSSLGFLMYKRFGDKSMTDENWSDHVQYVVADDIGLQIQLVDMLVKYGGLQKAAQWSLRYNLPRNLLPPRVWDAQQNLPPDLQQLSDSAQSEEWMPSEAHCQRFYQAPLPQHCVRFVDTLESLQMCRDALLKEGGVVGVDMEWQPTFGCDSGQQVSLIQLAAFDQVFLLDLCANSFHQHPETIAFISRLFAERNVLKLGYGMSGDVKCLHSTWHKFLEGPLKMEAMIDLLNIHQKIQCSNVSQSQKGPKEVLVGEDSVEKGLSLLVQQVLGKPLDKTEQMSNWKKRPLRNSQIRYAVADAYCLLDVYTALSRSPELFGLPDDLRSISSKQSEKRTDMKQTRNQRAKPTTEAKSSEECQGAQWVRPPHSDTKKGPLCGEEPLEGAPPLPPQQLRVVCDNMLQGLGRYLRCLGVDVVMLENDDDHRKAAMLAQAEDRVILTCGQPYQTLRSQVGEGRCLCLDCSEKARDQAVRVLRHFNVRPAPSDIFSRCQACNNDQYVAVPQEDMIRMARQKGLLLNQDSSHAPQDSPQERARPDGVPTPDLPRYTPQCQWADLSELDRDTLSFSGGAPIQLDAVPPGVLYRIPLFYVCTRCGKVFWEGSHFSRVVSMFQDVLRITDGAESAGCVPGGPHDTGVQNPTPKTEP